MKRNNELVVTASSRAAGKRNKLELVTRRACEECGGPIPDDARSDVKRCSTRCRMKASRRKKYAREREESMSRISNRRTCCWTDGGWCSCVPVSPSMCPPIGGAR